MTIVFGTCKTRMSSRTTILSLLLLQVLLFNPKQHVVLVDGLISNEIVQIDGSGTTNPSKCYWSIMDQLEAHAKLPVRYTYRAVGSTTGLDEFRNELAEVPAADFASADFSMGGDQYAALRDAGIEIVQLPVLLGALGIFHSVPIGSPLNLTACLLARIFDRRIAVWNHPDIVKENPNLPRELQEANVQPDLPIQVARRIRGSSSTFSTTKYLGLACPDVWPADRHGEVLDWHNDTLPCKGSSGVTKCIEDNVGTVGYIDAGHGHSNGLSEVRLQSGDETKFFTSKDAFANDGIRAAAEQPGVLPAEGAAADFGTATPLLHQAGPWTWPLVQMTYIMVRKNLTAFIPTAREQGLLIAFLKAMYNPKFNQQCATEYSFTIPDETVRDFGLAGIDQLDTLPGAADYWKMEETTEPLAGQADDVISINRKSGAFTERRAAQKVLVGVKGEVAALQTQLAEAMTVINLLKEELNIVEAEKENGGQQQGGGGLESTATASSVDGGIGNFQKQKSQLNAALALSSLSFIICIFLLIKMFITNNNNLIETNIQDSITTTNGAAAATGKPQEHHQQDDEEGSQTYYS